jgi:hypothetical protein
VFDYNPEFLIWVIVGGIRVLLNILGLTSSVDS